MECEKLLLPKGRYGSTDNYDDTIEDGIGVSLSHLHSKRERSVSIGSVFKRSPINDYDDIMKTSASVDEFQDLVTGVGNKIMRTGRQRKKLAARVKGGDFQSKRKKRRVYFCCVGNEIDLDQLHEHIDSKWEAKMYEDVLHLYMIGKDNNDISSPKASNYTNTRNFNNVKDNIGQTTDEDFSDMITENPENVLSDNENNNAPMIDTELDSQNTQVLWNSYGRECFIFAFGVAVFWSFHRGEEDTLINQIRAYVAGGELSDDEYFAGQDDMAFILSSEDRIISIANDVINLPNNSSAKNRLAVSFAIAQSSVLGIFESRVEKKIEEYKYIPETLARIGRVRLTPKILGTMIGEVYVIRHDVNLHTEILDTPDFFWREDAVEPMYRMTYNYLEMDTRTEILNKRLDMLRELLGVLQQQHENENAMKLEVIVIWLIVISIIVELVQVFTEMVLMK